MIGLNTRTDYRELGYIFLQYMGYSQSRAKVYKQLGFVNPKSSATEEKKLPRFFRGGAAYWRAAEYVSMALSDAVKCDL